MCVNFVLVVNVFLALRYFFKKLIVNYIIYPNNILFNRKNAFYKILTKRNFIQYNHFLTKVSVFCQTHYFQQNALSRMHSSDPKIEDPNAV